MNNTSKPDTFKHSEAIKASLKKRYARERRFQWYGRLAVLTGFVFLFILLFDIISKGYPAFTQQFIKVSVNLDLDQLDLPPNATEEQLFSANYLGVIKASLREMFPDVSGRKDKQQLYRLLSVGAEYNPRAKVMKEAADEVLAELGIENDPLLSIAKRLEEIALSDPYFIERKLYPNVDFYSGIILKAIGIPTSMFTVIFAVGRTVGWIAHWNEMIAGSYRIGRPRQLYTGYTQRDYLPLDKR